MNLPHGEYLLFAKELVEQKEAYVVVDCIFPMRPTLSMFLEAAAQCTAGFTSEVDVKMGVLTIGKDIKILNNIIRQEYLLKVAKDVHIDRYHQFYFEALDKETGLKIVSGSLTLQIEV
ncbi:MAG: hypothetical protein L3J43_10160 [Sulfurovum sp.]|nr:hypothetical protein [Sulfurovum sp.]